MFITLNQNSNQNLLFRFVGNSLTTSMKTLLASMSGSFDTLRPKCATQILEVEMESEMPCGEGVATAGLEITFKGLSFRERFECDVGFYFPWEKLGCVGNMTGIVLGQADAEIGSATDVALIGAGETA